MVWWGACTGRAVISGTSRGSAPATLWILVTSSDSSKVIGGRIDASARASSVLPVPGGPLISTL